MPKHWVDWDELQDFEGSAGDLLRHVQELVTTYGETARVRFNAGANNVAVQVQEVTHGGQ